MFPSVCVGVFVGAWGRGGDVVIAVAVKPPVVEEVREGNAELFCPGVACQRLPEVYWVAILEACH